jgi:apolipoprotein N-acyltransferase
MIAHSVESPASWEADTISNRLGGGTRAGPNQQPDPSARGLSAIANVCWIVIAAGFVISPAGEIVFRQGKKVPIQFIKDGLPAPEQKLWISPWGKIGICICYDLSYSRVTDRLVAQGAQALIVPTMDVVDWGKRQHELHARVAPLRAAEYGIPVFRVASSGISQLVDPRGRIVANAPCPGEGAMLSGILEMRARGHLPPDRWFAPFATAIVGLLALVFLISQCRGFSSRSRPTAA